MEQYECRQSDGRASSNGRATTHIKREREWVRGKESRDSTGRSVARKQTESGGQSKQCKRGGGHKIIEDWNW